MNVGTLTAGDATSSTYTPDLGDADYEDTNNLDDSYMVHVTDAGP